MTDDYSARGLALLYRGWSRGGYKLGDKVAVIAGGSLIKNNTTFKAKVINFILNMDKYSSFGMTEKDMLDYITYVTNSKAKFVRGYVTSIYEIANLILKYNLSIQVKAVFTTAEMLTKHQRQVIEKAFDCSVFNTYGLNDGGVSAYECNEHNGFHIDVERSFLDVVDASGKPIVNEIGKIIATSYTNFGTCFFKYDTGDLGVLSSEQCRCGSPYPLLKNIQGRITESITYNSKTVGSPVLTVLMSSFDVNMYQFIQVDESKLILVIDKGATFNISDEKAIRDSIKSNLGEVVLEIVYDKARFEKLANGKHILVLNKMKKNEI
ncbi:phenylacetate--CoA ligase family protein [Pseudoalteromonas sp. MT33b]|uniref:phenylacetate--CoA ligase family protein n=1 Tax=Pseudoalteromonas sp. MT33b TaxID=2759705 RepID=UPI0015FA3A41|nr:phenylacetate--CoA ligase family protein [Pseudoalteromonas sp. MT33b]QMW14217.1 phenylacetate--CoA ligase family protein [Pseudoalteromonas sp. MT33b]